MLEHIENMKSKPEHIRKRYAFVVSFTFTMVILLGWLASYGITSSPVLTDSNAKGETKVDAPVTSLTASVGNIFNDLKTMFSSSNKVEYSSQIEVIGGKR